jgi:thioesterase domain-containing protein
LSNLSNDIQLSASYFALEPFEGKAIIFEADYSSDIDSNKVKLAKMWEVYLPLLTSIQLHGDHFTIMDEHNIKFIANRISHEILAKSYLSS